MAALWGKCPVLNRWGMGSECPALVPTAVLEFGRGFTTSPAASMSRSPRLNCMGCECQLVSTMSCVVSDFGAFRSFFFRGLILYVFSRTR